MTTTGGANNRVIVLHAVLTGLTPLVPIPFVDDLAKAYFKRRLVRKIVESHHLYLSAQDVKTLADEPDSGCLRGCLVTVLVYPLSKIFRKIFFILEWKRAIDTVSDTYYHGYLIDYAMGQRWCAPSGPRVPSEVRRAIDNVLRQVNTSLIERAVKSTFDQSKTVVKGGANLLVSSLRRVTGKPSEEQVAQAIQTVEQQEERQVEGIINQLQGAIETIPSEHFERLRSLLRNEMSGPYRQ
jgi:hypothetical protein